MTQVLDLDWHEFDRFSVEIEKSFAKLFEVLESSFRSSDPKEAITKLCTGAHRHLLLTPVENIPSGEVEANIPKLASRLYRSLRSYVLTMFATGIADQARAASRWYHSVADLLPNSPLSYALLSKRLGDTTYSREDNVQWFSGQLIGTHRRLGAHAATHDLIANAAFNNNWLELLPEIDRSIFEEHFYQLHDFFSCRVTCQHRELCSHGHAIRSITDHVDHFRTTRQMAQIGIVDLKRTQDRKLFNRTIRSLVKSEIPNHSVSPEFAANEPQCADLTLSLLGVKTATDALPHLENGTSEDLSAYVAARLNSIYQHTHRALYPLSIGRQLVLAAEVHREQRSDPLRVSELTTTAAGTMSFAGDTLTLHLPSEQDIPLSLGASQGTKVWKKAARSQLYRASSGPPNEGKMLHRMRDSLMSQCGDNLEARHCIGSNYLSPTQHNGNGWIIRADDRDT